MVDTRKITGTISTFTDFDKQFSFFVENGDDWIQRHHLAGRLYENEELKIIQNYSRQSRVFFDIGSNVGNHAIFMAKVLHATRVYSFEANPFAADILKINISLNHLSRIIDTSYVGMGLGEKLGIFNVWYPQHDNIGAARLVEGQAVEGARSEGAKIMVYPLDSINIGVEPDFIKIDVEGMEISVLKGMASTIKQFKPRLFVEVDDSNAGLFDEWLSENDYVKCESFRRYTANENFMIAPRSRI